MMLPPEISLKEQEIENAEKGEKFAVAVEHGVVEGTESGRHASHPGHTPVHHVEQAGKQHNAARPSGKRQRQFLAGPTGIYKHNGRHDVQHQAGGRNEVRGNPHPDHALHDGIDNLVNQLL